jgi:2EXR family
MATIFTFFQQLPYELRKKIWYNALSLFPRIVELRNMRSKEEFQKGAAPCWIAFPTPKPTLLSVNRESRQTLLPYYAKPFQARRICPHLGMENLLFNYELDTLFINIGFRWMTHSTVLFTDLFGNNFHEVKEHLKRLAGTEHFWATLLKEGRQRRIQGIGEEFMAGFKNLKEATVVADKAFPVRSTPWRLVRFVDLGEMSEEWQRLEEDLYPFFNFSRKKKYLERLCTTIERPSDSWKLRMR